MTSHAEAAAEQLPVLVVGGGPVGLTMANLLAARGVSVVLVERNSTTSDEAKAISLDDESLRTLQAADLAGRVLDIVVPGTGTLYYDRHGRPLVHARGPGAYRLGFPFKNQFAQPELEQVLVKALRERPQADVRFGTELLSLTETADGALATLRTAGADDSTRILAGWVLGCDGGRSTIRQAKGIGMTGTSHGHTWLVVDTAGDPHDERYGMHYGTPGRPTVVVPGRSGRCRYEFLLHPGEGEAGTKPAFETIRRLVAPYRDITEDQVERSTAYTFNAVLADRWRDGRCFLLGDAAHMMPPFAGQGLNSGVRDAANLAWKISEVWHGRAAERLLDTYEVERRPHATHTVRFSEQLGEIVMTTSRTRAFVRDMAVRALLRLPGGRRYLSEMRFRPSATHTDGVIIRTGNDPMVGAQLPQPRVLVAPSLRPELLDVVLGDGLALLGIDVDAAAWQRLTAHRAWQDLPNPIRMVDVALGDRMPRPETGRQAVADADGQLEAATGGMRGRFVLVKPDRYIAAAFLPDQAGSVGGHLAALMARAEPVPRAAGSSRTAVPADKA
ncbi:bifunctional 3-(3-hydroxy-phenyl)propionate/3-hydroxycinnamic acid hydroxylase [Streptomyces sp. NPDC020801]|uniref:bifunctional 3-(3-hydroxy-phenyl)propionate/3-hydroxycinnamic acid hydroxylase n=1 Tax=unclassified Streptomyces TaxID=2593676 RepID=UPI0037B05B6E